MWHVRSAVSAGPAGIAVPPSLVVVQMEDKTRNKKTRRNGRHAKSILYDTVVRMEHAASTCSQI